MGFNAEREMLVQVDGTHIKEVETYGASVRATRKPLTL